MSFRGETKSYGRHVLRHWVAVLPTGAVVALIGMGDLFGWYSLHVPVAAAFAVGVLGLVPSQFLAWRDSERARIAALNASADEAALAMEQLQRASAEAMAREELKKAHRAALAALGRLLADRARIANQYFSLGALTTRNEDDEAEGARELRHWAVSVREASEHLSCPYQYADLIERILSTPDRLMMHNWAVDVARQVELLIRIESGIS